jgi:hypothetical protein
VNNEIVQLQAAIAARMQELRTDARDPRLAPMIEQLRGLIHQHTLANSPWAQPAGDVVLAQNFSANLPERLQELVRDYLTLARKTVISPFAQAPGLSESDQGRALTELPAADKAAVGVQAYVAWSLERYGGRDGAGLRRVVSDLFRAKLDLDDAQAIALVKAATQQGFSYASYSPNQAVASVLARHVQTRGLSGALKDAVTSLRARMVQDSCETNSEGRKLLSAVEALLGHEKRAEGAEPVFAAKPDAWGKAVGAKLAALPQDRRRRATGLLELAAKGGGNAKPAKGWLASAQKELAGAEKEGLGAVLLDLIEGYEPGDKIALENQNTVRGLIWLAALADSDSACRRLEAYAEKCLTFSPQHFAYLSLVLGNASIHAFALMPGMTGVGSLTRLKRRLKRPGEIKTVDKALAALASARSMTSGELEEIGLPQYGFDSNGTLDSVIGPATATLTISDDASLETSWRDGNGKALSGPPSAVKDGHAEELKAFKARAKEIGETLKAQRLRLERLYLDDRVWPLVTWRSRYLEEPLLSGFARRLIWSFEHKGRWIAALPQSDGMLDGGGVRLDLDDKTRVKLWHPMQAEAAHVLAWRKRLQSLEITQPFKQAHREIYVLTDAERGTGTYSNRFASHIVEQHLFRALCQARGWKCPAFGMWDGGDARPMKVLPERKMQVEFWVDPVESSINNEAFQFRYLATEQVRFANDRGAPMELAQIDPVVFSELMRDADLFVGVAGIGSIQDWTNTGDERLDRNWQQAAFGELSETGKTRHAVLKDLLSGLAIAPKCKLEERYLVVQGKLRSYRIHLGSSNIQMEHNSQYLCIVRDRQNAYKNVRLPFEGDETLSLILSKAFMLADDDKIKDPSIRRQIEGVKP